MVLQAGVLLLTASCTVGAPRPDLPRYPVAAEVVTTRTRTVVHGNALAATPPVQLSEVSRFAEHQLGRWTAGAPGPTELRTDLMPASYQPASIARSSRLLNFFAWTDVHITDEESPAQLIFLQQYLKPGRGQIYAWQTSVYSPVMPYTTQVLDAAVQTVNALHRRDPFDFGIGLGDASNSTQYNELRWYLDVIDGKVVAPSSGAHAGARDVDSQRPFQAAGLDRGLPFYQALGNHDHLFMGSLPVNAFLRQAYVSDTVLATGDLLWPPTGQNLYTPDLYTGYLDGSTPFGDIRGAGPSVSFASPPRVVADPDRRSLLRTEWIAEFFKTSSTPVGHGFNLVDPAAGAGFACYSFVPRAGFPLKVIVLDDTQSETDGDTTIHGHGYLDQARYDWLKRELKAGDEAGQLMIIAAHIPIGVQPPGSFMEWWASPLNAVRLFDLVAELQAHPNLLMWIAGHRHVNTVKAFKSSDPAFPEKGFWQVETSSLRDFPQQLRTFEVKLNGDDTVSVLATNVDTAVQDGTPAARSRMLAVATDQLARNNLSPNFEFSVPLNGGNPADKANFDPGKDLTIKPMGPSLTYNAELIKPLSPAMKARLRALFP
jgi:metallophosphoesterase (TIGR03768 family)